MNKIVRQQCAILGVASAVLSAGCAQDMMNQPRLESQERAVAYADGTAARPIPEGAITAAETAMGAISLNLGRIHPNTDFSARTEADRAYFTGQINGELIETLPKRITKRFETRELIERGRERFNIFCLPCHDVTGSGNGMVPRRGFPFPPSYHTARLRSKPISYFFNVATHGHSRMPNLGDQIPTDDRWAIAAYVRTLQFSQYAPIERLNEADRSQLPSAEGAESMKGGDVP